MKIEVLTSIAHHEKSLNDRYKIMAGLLTFLHKKYPTTDCFILYSRDVKAILDQHLNASVPPSEPGIRIGYKTSEYTRCYIPNAARHLNETTEWTIQEGEAKAVWTYLMGLMKRDEDWELHTPTNYTDEYGRAKIGSFATRRRECVFTPAEIYNLFSKKYNGRTSA